MDRRQLKTRRAIFRAFRSLLERKRYDHITVQEILDEADVGRSTFYAHFETKDMLLGALCEDLFNHIFESDPCPFAGMETDLQGALAHILWHIRDSKNNLSGILRSDSSPLFMAYFKTQLQLLFEAYIPKSDTAVPHGFALNHLAGSFAEAVYWWIEQDMMPEPETVAGYFMDMTVKFCI